MNTSDAILERAGLRTAANRKRLIAWWARYEQATGKQPDVMRHLRVLRRGLRFPVRRHGDAGLELRRTGEPRVRA